MRTYASQHNRISKIKLIILKNLINQRYSKNLRNTLNIIEIIILILPLIIWLLHRMK